MGEKIRYKRTGLSFLLVVLVNMAYSQLVAWQFSLPQPSTGRETQYKATTLDKNLRKSVLTRGPAAPGVQGNSNGFSGNLIPCTTREGAQAVGAYYQFTIRAKKGNEISLLSLNSLLRRQESSAYIYRWMYSLDGETFKALGDEDVVVADKKNNGVRQPNIDLKRHDDLQNIPSSKTVTFRLYAWGGNKIYGSDIAFGFGKSNTQGSNVLAVYGTIEKEK
ncbi:MAG: hypothetical protein Q7J05_03930 [Paludibacter sp.]|nr:hypothetical protein [Paludibacter sp.]